MTYCFQSRIIMQMENDMEMATLRTAIEKAKLEIAYRKYYDELLKKILLVLRPVIARLNDTDFNLLIVLIQKDLFNPSAKKGERSYILEIYDRLENIIRKYEYLLDDKKAQRTYSLTRKEEREMLICIHDLLARERGAKRITISTDAAILETDRRTEEYRDKSEKNTLDEIINSRVFIPSPKSKRISLRQYALEKGLNYETFRALLHKYPLLANEITAKELRGKKILYNVKDSSPLLPILTGIFKGYDNAKSLYSGWIKLLKKEKGITKSGATKWMQRKIRNGVIPPEFFYCKTYIPIPVSQNRITTLLWRIDRSINKPIIPKKQWKNPDKRKATYEEIVAGLQTLENNRRKIIKETKKMLKQTYDIIGIPPKIYQPFISKITSLGN